jgi:3-keto-disaccharide hydrolase
VSDERAIEMIRFAGLLPIFILLTLPSSSSAQDDSIVEPISLIRYQSLDGWANPNFPNGVFWRNVGDVKLGKDDQVLHSVEGSGVLWLDRRLPNMNLLSRGLHADIRLHLEFRLPKSGNTGVYLMGRYEIDLRDSHGREATDLGTCGTIAQRFDSRTGLYHGGVSPMCNAFENLDRWQSLDVIFRAPRFDDRGKKIENARFVEVRLNDVLIHREIRVGGPTRGSWYSDEKLLGPIMLEGASGPAAFRNILITHIYLE